MKSEVTLPVEAKENPIAFLERLMATVSEKTISPDSRCPGLGETVR